MSALLGRAVVELAAQTATFQNDMRKAQRSFDYRMGQMKKSTNKLQAGFASIALGAKALVGVAAVAGLSRLTVGSVAAGDALQKLGLRLDDSVENLSRLIYVGERSGVEMRTLARAMQTQRRVTQEAASGYGEAQNAIKALGLEASELALLPVSEQFRQIAAQMQKVEDTGARQQIAFKLWQAEGIGLLQVVNQGAEAMRQMEADADAASAVVSTEFANSAALAADNWTDLSEVLGSFYRILLKPVLDGFNLLAIAVRKAQTILGEFVADFRAFINEIRGVETVNIGEVPGLTIRGTKPAGVEKPVDLSVLKRETKERDKSVETTRRLADQMEILREFTRSTATETDRLGSMWDQLGFSFESAFEGAIIEGNKMRDVIRGLVDDMARLVLRQAVTAPLANALGNALGSAFGPPSPGQLGQNAGQYLQPPATGDIRNSSGQFGPVVTVNNNSGLPATTQTNLLGGRSVTEVTVGSVASDIRQGGDVWRALNETTGARRRGVIRG